MKQDRRHHGAPVCIRGVIYISQRAAARAFGVHETTIRRALDGGCIDEIGLKDRRSGGRPGKACTYRGRRYPSRTAAARACGVSVAAVSRAVKAAAQRVWKVAA